MNLRVGDNAVSVIKLNPPYDMMVDLSENSSWSGGADFAQTFRTYLERAKSLTFVIEKLRELIGVDDGRLLQLRM